MIMAHAIIDPEAAWSEAQQLTGYDDGNTKSNTLYWIGTRPGSNDCPDCTTRPPQPTDQPTNKPTTHPPVDGCDCHPGGTTVDPRFKFVLVILHSEVKCKIIAQFIQLKVSRLRKRSLGMPWMPGLWGAGLQVISIL